MKKLKDDPEPQIDQSPLEGSPQVLLPGPKVRHRYGNVTAPTLRRWQESRGFPKPIKIGARSFYEVSALLEWERKLFTSAGSAK